MSESTALAPASQSALPARSLLKELAEAAGLDPKKYYDTVKALCGCNGASDEHFAALMMVAQGVGLNPIMSQMYLVPTQGGKIKPVIGVDGYLVFLHRALKDGTIEWHDYEDVWIPDPKLSPEKAAQAPVRAGRVTLKFKGREKPIVHAEFWAEVFRDTGPWKQHGARMLRHKAYSQAIRYHLGLYIPDAEEAGAVRSDEPRAVEAEVRDTTPAIPIRGVKLIAPPPADLEMEPQRTDPSSGAAGEAPGAVPSRSPQEIAPPSHALLDESKPVAPGAPAPAALDDLPDPNSEEGKRLAKELDAEVAKGLFPDA